MSGSPDQHVEGGPQEGGAAAAAPTAAAAADELQELGPPRVSEELRPMSLTDLFAGDPECAKPKQEPGQAGLARTHTFAGAGLDDELELKKLQVFVRIRPGVTAGAPRWDAENCIHATSKYSIAIAPPEGSQAYKSGDRGQTYSFTRVFDEHTAQTEYYEATAAPLVRDLLRNARHNSVMMAYGITAAGKTYTIEGTKHTPGVMPRALVDLFAGLAAHVEPLVARASYYEVYNEQIYDLLDEHGVGPLGQRAALRLKEDTLGRVFVAGLSEAEVGSADEALALLRRGSRQRQRGETALNYSSSRSHSIFTITLYQQGLEGQDSEGSGSGEEAEEGVGGGEERLGRISFVDLAGSERAQRTGNVGVRLKESVAINSSLMTLGRCLEALRWNQQHKGGGNLRVVPYRESKVTHLFRDALHGWGQVLLSVNVSPASKDYDETAHVLKYAALATQIGTIQAAEAPRRTIKAVSPAIKKVKRKAALPPEARGQGAKAKKAKKAAAAPAAAGKQADLEAAAEAGEDAAGEPDQQQQDDEQAAQQEGEEQIQQLRAGSEEASVEPSPLGVAATAEEGGPAAAPADVAEYELGEGEWEGTPATPLGDGEEDEATAALQDQVQQLIGDLQRAEERCVLLEAEVREEVADEMAQLLRDMEESYRQRLEGEVAALEKKMAAGGAAEGGRRGKRGGKGGKTEQNDAAEELAAAHEEAAQAAAVAEQLRQQVAELQAAAERQQAEADERAAALQAAVDAAQQAAAQAQEQLAAEQRRTAGLEAELATARQAAAEAAASLGSAQQHAAELEDELASAKLQAAAAAVDAATEHQRAAVLEEELTAARAAADSSQVAASQQYEAQLQEAVTQLEANKGMELEMAEEQAERLRKENLALQQRLGAALAALATYGSPSAGGPAGLVARMAQASGAIRDAERGFGMLGSMPAATGSTVPAKAAAQVEKENAPAEQPPAAQGSLAAALAAIRRSGGGAAAAQAAAKAVAAADIENAQQEKQQQAEQQEAAASDAGRGGKRKRRLLPSAPISLEMRAALGEVDGESVPLRQQIAARQAAAAVPADGGGKRSRRQTKFFRL
ncbi:Kinesin KIF19 [Chlorella sorokiniana]|uniref:Kinesin KIF19 n=1 Tax=Chlorella sorokiniana TaxID=3076 RepID=A0A2P6TTK5_CHLSO|nr:Kinesin KIF19 [Chlorella sorokiniana]|eukprot:PRW57364.1 Kinesin KIF19 [Chlorella sorokiniana]